MSTYETIEAEREHEGRVLRLRLAQPKANILDRKMMGELQAAVAAHAGAPELAAIVIEGSGKHFSFGASVEEHTSDQVRDMLPEFHAMFRNLTEPGVPLVALVRGQCLGGGFELAMVCDLIFADAGAHMGVPEIRLGVFPPVACALLPGRVGVSRANDLLLTGRSWTAPEAFAAGLITTMSEPGELESDFQAWATKHLLPLSGSSLRIATRAARLAWRRGFLADLEELERMYLEELVPTHDANEGIEAFLEKRPPAWNHGAGNGAVSPET